MKPAPRPRFRISPATTALAVAIAATAFFASHAGRAPATAGAGAAPVPAHANPSAPASAVPAAIASPDVPADLARALRFAKPSQREAVLLVVLREWGATDIDGAGAWALAQDEIHPDKAMSAVLAGAAARPAEAVRYVGELSAAFPGRRADFGSYLISALGAAGQHVTAAAYAATAADTHANDWLTAAYKEWARSDPGRALASVEAIGNPERHLAAFHAAISGWAGADPARLAASALQMPAGTEQRFALTTALRSWAEIDPDAAADWIARSPVASDLAHVLDD